MRTGTHYFPRGVSSVAVEQTRQKFGLNKIDETTGNDSLLINNNAAIPNSQHRRTESLSCELGRRHFGVNTAGVLITEPLINTNAHHLLGGKHVINSNTGLSPDVQRRLALQNYKAMECKFISTKTYRAVV